MNGANGSESRGSGEDARPLLETHALVRRFGGLTAVDDVSIDVAEGEVRALIGPNGAGKSTLVAMLCGRLRPTSGSVHFEGRDVTRLAASHRARLGMGYTFQITRIFDELDVREHVMLGLARRSSGRRRDAHSASDATRVASGAASDEIASGPDAALERFGLADLAGRRAGKLAYGHRRLLEVAMAVAAGPRLLMLDEPTQGLADVEIDQFIEVIRDLARDTTILLIEHNMEVVMALATRISVLHEGRLLADGSPADIRADPAVQAAYLGTGTAPAATIDGTNGT